MQLILSGMTVTALEAHQIGLVNAVFSPAELLPSTIEFVKLVLSKGILAVRAAVDCINMADQLSIAEGLAYESRRFGQLCGTADFREGTAAFLEKRKVEYKGK